jgi:PemK-like, MazF-like toxin of type II toxin-antitoxin system
MGRGEVWLINLGPMVGAEIKKTRPAVIVNDDTVGILPRLRKMRRVILHDTSSAFPPFSKGG